MQLVVKPGHQVVDFSLGPMREGWCATYQLGFGQSGHLAKSRVDIGDAALQIQRAHAGEHGVFHGAAKVGFRYQRLLRLDAAPGMAPRAKQHPHRQGAERADEPEKATADHAQRGAITLGPDEQAVADRRDRYLIFSRTIGPGQQARGWIAGRRYVACQHAVFIVHQGHRIFGGDFCRHAKTQQTVNSVFTHDHATKLALVVQRHQNLQCGRVVVAAVRRVQRPRIHRLTQVAGQAIGTVGLAGLQLVAGTAQLGGIGTGRHIRHLDAPLAVNPGHRQQLRVLVDQRLSLRNEFFGINLLVGDIAANAHQLLLSFQQAQPKPLLGVFNIPFDGLLLAVDFLDPQVTECSNHGRQKQHHGQQRPERDEAVLP